MGSTIVLVIDADDASRSWIIEVLQRDGCEIHPTATTSQALKLSEQQLPDAAVIAVDSLDPSGFDVARYLHSKGNVPVLFTASDDNPSLINECVAAGGLGFLLKPISSSQLCAALTAVLAVSGKIRRLAEAGTQLQSALTGERETSVAVGLLMERFHVDMESAFEMFRSYSRAQRRRMNDLAREMIAAANLLNQPFQHAETNMNNQPPISLGNSHERQ